MTVAEVEVIIGGDDRGAQKAFDRTAAGAKATGAALTAVQTPVAALKDTFIKFATESTTSVKTKFADAFTTVKVTADEAGTGTAAAFGKIDKAADSTSEHLKATTATLRNFSRDTQSAGIGLSAALSTPLLMAARAGLKYAGDFEQSLSVFRVTANATAEDMKKVSAEAIKLGNDALLPATSATDAAHAMLELAHGGLSVKDALTAAHGVLEMSAAANISNADAAKIAAHALNAFALEGTKANMVSDLLASAATASGASMTEIADGLAQSASVYHSAGISIADLTTSLTLLQKAGIKGSDAGTSLKQMMLALENPHKEAATEIKNLGIQIYDAKGKMMAYQSIIDQFNKATIGLTAKQRDFSLGVIFGSDAVRAANIVISEGKDKFAALEAIVTKQGVAAKMAAAQNDGFRGSLDAAASSGQTMLQGFLTPALPILTDFFKRSSDMLNTIDGWDPASKAAAGGVAILLAVVGPAVVAVGAFARGISGVIALTTMFRGAQAAKAAALALTTTSATAAATAEDAEALSTKGMSISALLAVPAIESEAVALDTVAASAGAASVALTLLRGSMAVLATAAAGWAVGTMISGQLDKVAQSHGYDNGGDALFKKTGFDGSFAGIGNLLDGDDSEDKKAQFNGSADAGQVKKWVAATKQREAATSLRNYLDSENKKDAASVVARAKEDADAQAKAAAARYTAAEAASKQKKKKKGGKSDDEKDEAARIREEKQEYKALTDQIYEVTKAKALLGKAGESLSVQYDIDHGRIDRSNRDVAKQLIGVLKGKEGAEAAAASDQKAQDAKEAWAQATLDHVKAMAAETIGLSDQDRVSMTMFGKKFANLTEEHNKQKVLWQLEEDQAKTAKDLFDSGQEYAKTTLADLKNEIAQKSILTKVDQARRDINERSGRGEAITTDQARGIMHYAQVLDDSAWQTELGTFADQLNATMDDAVAKVKEARDKAIAESTGRYDTAMAELHERMTMAGDDAEKTTYKTIKLAESFGTGATAADKITSGMTRAKAVMAATLQVDKVEAFRVKIKALADQTGDYFAKMSTDLLTNFKISYKGIVSGFEGMLADMGRQYAASQIKAGVSGLVGKLLGGLGGGGGFASIAGAASPDASTPFYHATGGPVLSNQAVMVGERGPEMFVPSGNGSIMTAAQTKAATGNGGGQPINVTINVAAPNPGAFHDSVPQTMQKVGRAIQAVRGSFG